LKEGIFNLKREEFTLMEFTLKGINEVITSCGDYQKANSDHPLISSLNKEGTEGWLIEDKHSPLALFITSHGEFDIR
jgi:hypothetical protein